MSSPIVRSEVREKIADNLALVLVVRRAAHIALAEMTGTVTSVGVVWLFKQSAAMTRGYVRNQAVIGLTGVQAVMAQTVAQLSRETFHLFDSRELATAWLAIKRAEGGLVPPGERPTTST